MPIYSCGNDGDECQPAAGGGSGLTGIDPNLTNNDGVPVSCKEEPEPCKESTDIDNNEHKQILEKIEEEGGLDEIILPKSPI